MWQPAFQHAVPNIHPLLHTVSTDTNWPILQLTSLNIHTGGCSATPLSSRHKQDSYKSFAQFCKPRRDILITFDNALACADCWGVHTTHLVDVLSCFVLCHLVLRYSSISSPIHCNVPIHIFCHLVLHYSSISSPIHCNVPTQPLMLLRFPTNSYHCVVTLLPRCLLGEPSDGGWCRQSKHVAVSKYYSAHVYSMCITLPPLSGMIYISNSPFCDVGNLSHGS
jgi:hypothetical protein